ncbi:Uncharacterized protein Adt_31734 [Abeliophyllum distichum]|uniref:Uncharacterized protein n=1 Tax=Abeliophyllum distichum TaxID=126358 RepID=A0ABD1REZ1_9LAMI
MGQMAVALSGIAPGSLPSNTEVNSKEHVKALTTRSGVQLPEMHVKRSVANTEKAKATMVTLQLLDRSIKHPRRVVEVLLVKVDKFIFPADFIILDVEKDRDVPLLLGRPFLATSRAPIDVQKGQLILMLSEEKVTFDVFKVIKYPTESDSSFKVDVIDNAVHENFQRNNPSDPLEACIMYSQSTHADSGEVEMCARYLKANLPYIC